MWKDYSIGFIKKNRASSVSVLVAAFISALFLSLLCGLFYNFWNYEIESVVLEEGNWQGRISGAFEEDKVSEIENFANVKTAIINEDLSDDQTLVVDICFDNMRAVYQDIFTLVFRIFKMVTVSRHSLFWRSFLPCSRNMHSSCNQRMRCRIFNVSYLRLPRIYNSTS